jgi:hypothetical protein
MDNANVILQDSKTSIVLGFCENIVMQDLPLFPDFPCALFSITYIIWRRDAF